MSRLYFSFGMRRDDFQEIERAEGPSCVMTSQKRSLPPVQTIHVLRPLISSRREGDAAIHVVEEVLVGSPRSDVAARCGDLTPRRAPSPLRATALRSWRAKRTPATMRGHAWLRCGPTCHPPELHFRPSRSTHRMCRRNSPSTTTSSASVRHTRFEAYPFCSPPVRWLALLDTSTRSAQFDCAVLQTSATLRRLALVICEPLHRRRNARRATVVEHETPSTPGFPRSCTEV